MKFLFKNLIVLILPSLFIIQAEAKLDCNDKLKTHRYEMVRIFMEEKARYLLMMNNGSNVFSLYEIGYRSFDGTFYSVRDEITFIADVPPTEPMYVIETICDSDSNFYVNRGSLEIHLHSISSLEGAGWERSSGKTTVRGSTQIIE